MDDSTEIEGKDSPDLGTISVKRVQSYRREQVSVSVDLFPHCPSRGRLVDSRHLQGELTYSFSTFGVEKDDQSRLLWKVLLLRTRTDDQDLYFSVSRVSRRLRPSNYLQNDTGNRSHTGENLDPGDQDVSGLNFPVFLFGGSPSNFYYNPSR